MDELRAAIGKVVAGQKYFATSIVETMFEELTVLSRESRWRQRARQVSLTEREKGVLALIAVRYCRRIPGPTPEQPRKLYCR